MEHNPSTPPGNTTNRPKQLFHKAIATGFIGLILLIPLLMVQGLVHERQSLSDNVQDEITSKWGGQQSITTPVLVIPYDTPDESDETSYLYLLPREVHTTGALEIELRHRSIYKVPVYTSNIHFIGSWHTEDIHRRLQEKPGAYNLNEAKVIMAVNDPRGFRDILYLNVGDRKIKMKAEHSLYLPTCFNTSGSDSDRSMHTNNIQSAAYPIDLNSSDSIITFSGDLRLLGSRSFGILSLGNSSDTSIKGNWAEPSFQGGSLPIQTSVSAEGFEAEWKTMFAETYLEEQELDFIESNETYVDFVNSTDQYTQTDRSIKYGILIIGLTLLSIFLIDLVLHRRGKSINALHYLLTGLSLVLFYALLLSFSEIIGFGWAYLLAAVMTIGLNTLYFRAIIRENRTALILGATLAFLYVSVFILLSMETYALLIGSLWLFVILAFVMFLSAKIIRTQ